MLAKKRAASFPDVPTMQEAGIRDQESDALTGVVVPAATPKDVIALLHREIAKAFAQQEVRQRLGEEKGAYGHIKKPEGRGGT